MLPLVKSGHCGKTRDFRDWHSADNPTVPASIRYWSNSGHQGNIGGHVWPLPSLGTDGRWMGLFPKMLSGFKRIDFEIFPPLNLIPGLMKLSMVAAAKWNRKFIADLKTDGPRLCRPRAPGRDRSHANTGMSRSRRIIASAGAQVQCLLHAQTFALRDVQQHLCPLFPERVSSAHLPARALVHRPVRHRGRLRGGDLVKKRDCPLLALSGDAIDGS